MKKPTRSRKDCMDRIGKRCCDGVNGKPCKSRAIEGMRFCPRHMGHMRALMRRSGYLQFIPEAQ